MADARRSDRGEPPRLIGRSDVALAIDHCLEEARDGRGGGVLLTGSGGIGKSQALRAAVVRARELGFRAASGRALPDELPAPFSLVREMIASLAADELRPVVPTEPTEETALPPLFIPVVPVAGEVDGRPRGSAEATTHASLEQVLAPTGWTSIEGLGAGRHRLYGRLVAHFLRLASEAPLLVAVDDIESADRSSLEFLERLAREAPGARLALVATAGHEASEAVKATLDGIARGPSFRAVDLRPMTVAEAGEFARELLDGIAPPPDLVERWHAETGGNPLFLEQLVRATLGPGERLGAAGGGSGGNDLVSVLLRRIRALDEGERRVLTYAAVLGREFDFDRLRAVVGLDEERITEALDRLVLAGLLRERGGEVYEFASEAVRASVHADLTETRRRILHRKVAEALERHGGAGDFELARQFYLGRDDTKTARYSLRAAEEATRSFAFDTAASQIARALEAMGRLPDSDPRIEVRLRTEEGRLLHEAGELQRSEEILSEAVVRARALPSGGPEVGRAILALAWTRVDQSDFASAEALATEAARLLERSGTPRDQFSVHRVLGTVYWRNADLLRAEEHQRIALAIADRHGTPLERGHALVDVANTLVPRGPETIESALTLYARAAELFATADDPASRARVMMNRAVLEQTAGRREEARRDIAIAIEAAERAQSPMWIGYCELNLAQWEAEDGQVAAARAALGRAVRAVGTIGDLLSLQQIAMAEGMIAEAAGAYEDAERRFQEALERARTMGLAAEASEMLFRLARLAALRGDPARARRWLGEAWQSGLRERRPDLVPRAEELDRQLPSVG